MQSRLYNRLWVGTSGLWFFCVVPSEGVHFLEHAIISPVRSAGAIHLLLKHSETVSEGWGFSAVSMRRSHIKRTPQFYLCNVILNLFILSNTLSKIHMFRSSPCIPGILQVVLWNRIHTMLRFTPRTAKNLELHRNTPILTHLMWSVICHG